VSKQVQCREGEDAANRFRELTEKVVSVPKSEIDKRAAKDRAKRDREKTEETES
jgi:hypothetical protein